MTSSDQQFTYLTDTSVVSGDSLVDYEQKVPYSIIPDVLKENLEIVFISINPLPHSYGTGHHYSNQGQCIYQAGLVPELIMASDEVKCLEYGMGFTNLVTRPTKGAAELPRAEIRTASNILLEKMRKYQPKIAVFNGKGIYEAFLGNKNFRMGRQPGKLQGTDVDIFVMPSSSARCAQLPRAEDKMPFFIALKKLRDLHRGTIIQLAESEVVFDDYTEFRVTTPDVKSMRKAEKRRQRKALVALIAENGGVPPPGVDLSLLHDPKSHKSGAGQEVKVNIIQNGQVFRALEDIKQAPLAKKRPSSNSRRLSSSSKKLNETFAPNVSIGTPLNLLNAQTSGTTTGMQFVPTITGLPPGVQAHALPAGVSFVGHASATQPATAVPGHALPTGQHVYQGVASTPFQSNTSISGLTFSTTATTPTTINPTGITVNQQGEIQSQGQHQFVTIGPNGQPQQVQFAQPTQQMILGPGGQVMALPTGCYTLPIGTSGTISNSGVQQVSVTTVPTTSTVSTVSSGQLQHVVALNQPQLLSWSIPTVGVTQTASTTQQQPNSQIAITHPQNAPSHQTQAQQPQQGQIVYANQAAASNAYPQQVYFTPTAMGQQAYQILPLTTATGQAPAHQVVQQAYNPASGGQIMIAAAPQTPGSEQGPQIVSPSGQAVSHPSQTYITQTSGLIQGQQQSAQISGNEPIQYVTVAAPGGGQHIVKVVIGPNGNTQVATAQPQLIAATNVAQPAQAQQNQQFVEFQTKLENLN